jgi:two-component system chemotaxis sensor kinase CheA
MDKEILEQFVFDAEELIDSADEALINLEAGQGDASENLAVLLRGLHTLKGTAAFFDLTLFSTFAHFLEDMIQPFKDQGTVPDPGVIADLFLGISLLRRILEGLNEGRKEEDFKEEIEQFKQEIAGAREKSEPPEQPKEPESKEDSKAEVISGDNLSAESVASQEKPQSQDRVQDKKTAAESDTEKKRSDKKATARPVQETSASSQNQSQPEKKGVPGTEQPGREKTVAAKGKKTGQAVKTASRKRKEPFLKVRSQKVDELMDMVAEFGVALAEVFHHPALKEIEVEGLEEKQHQVEVLLRKLQDIAAGLRLVPVSTLFRPMQRLVRDLARTTGKQLALKMEGEETELDKVVIEALHDPLVHMIRNSADHGIEPPEERKAAGKPEKGTITLRAAQRGGEVIIEVEDDGRGLNRQAILQKARERGLLGPDDEPDDRTLYQFIFHPGFSTAKQITSVSGRGVGMDVVNAAVSEVRGRIEIDSKPGQGSKISICIPLTLAFLDSMIVVDKNILYAIPTENVKEVLQPRNGWLVQTSADNIEMVHVRDELIPIVRLEEFFRLEEDERDLHSRLLVIVRGERGGLAIPVDEIIGQQQVTIKPLQGHAKDIKAGAGWALLGSGDTALVLDTRRLG